MRISVLLLLAAAAAPLAMAQETLVEWAQIHGTGPLPSQPPTGEVPAGGIGVLTPFATRADFDLAFPPATQTCEGFENGAVAPGAIVGFPAPLNNTTNTAEFPAGSIVPGIQFQDNPLNDAGGGSANGLVAIGAGAFGVPSTIVLANTFIDSLDILLTAGTATAVAMDAFSFTLGGNVQVAFFDTSDAFLGGVTVAGSPTTGAFVGVSSPVPIGRINLFSQDANAADEAEGGDDICFATAGGQPLPPPPSIPALNPTGLIALALVLLALGALALRRSLG